MDIRSIKMRLQWLELQKAQEENPEKKLELLHRMMECTDWLQIEKENPHFGEDVKVDGQWVPKLPTFKSKEEMQKVLDDPVGREGRNAEEMKAAREWRMRKDGQEQADYLDGKNPQCA